MNTMTIIGLTIGVVAALFAVGIVVLMIVVARKSMRSAPRPDTPILSRATLLDSLRRLNNPAHPFVVRGADDADLRIEWDIVDARWIEALGPGAEQVRYRAWLALDDRTKTVEYYETLLQKSVTAGGPTVGFATHTTSGFLLSGRRSARRWAIGTDFRVGEVVNYEFRPDDVKHLVRQVANDAGWTFQLRLTKPKPTISSEAPRSNRPDGSARST